MNLSWLTWHTYRTALLVAAPMLVVTSVVWTPIVVAMIGALTPIIANRLLNATWPALRFRRDGWRARIVRVPVGGPETPDKVALVAGPSEVADTLEAIHDKKLIIELQAREIARLQRETRRRAANEDEDENESTGENDALTPPGHRGVTDVTPHRDPREGNHHDMPLHDGA